MRRVILGFHRDERGDWVAELACGHGRHVRHRPPFQERPWVLEEATRAERLGTPLECPLCDRCELPRSLVVVRSTPVWDERTLPPALRRAHRLTGLWGRITVLVGRLRFGARVEPPLEVVLEPGSRQAIPPDVEHEVERLGPVRFSIEFLAPAAGEEGGEAACFAPVLCPECGAVLDRGPHLEGCTVGRGLEG